MLSFVSVKYFYLFFSVALEFTHIFLFTFLLYICTKLFYIYVIIKAINAFGFSTPNMYIRSLGEEVTPYELPINIKIQALKLYFSSQERSIQKET